MDRAQINLCKHKTGLKWSPVTDRQSDWHGHDINQVEEPDYGTSPGKRKTCSAMIRGSP